MSRGSLTPMNQKRTKWRGRIDVISSNGKRKQVSKVFNGKKREVNEEFHDWVSEIKLKNFQSKIYTVSDLFKIFFEEHCETQIKTGGMKPTTKDWYSHMYKRISTHFGEKNITKLSFRDFETFALFLAEEGVGKKYLYEHFSLMRHCFNYAVVNNLLDENYIKKYLKLLRLEKAPKRKRVQTLNDYQIGELLKVAERRIKPLYTMIHIGEDTGLRRAELLALRWSDIDWERRNIHVNHQLQKDKTSGNFELVAPKVYSIRSIPMSQKLYPILKRHQKEEKQLLGDHYDEEGYIINNGIGKPIDPNLASAWFREIAKEAKVVPPQSDTKQRGYGLHTLRHTFASKLIYLGASCNEVSELLGHHAPSFTQNTYVHEFNEARKMAIQKLDQSRCGTFKQLDRHRDKFVTYLGEKHGRSERI